MTDTTELPHSRACGINCNGHGAACSRDCPTCAGHPDWTPDAETAAPHEHAAGADCFPGCPGWSTPAPGGRGYAVPVSGGVRATIAVERLCRLFPKLGRIVRTEGPPLTTAELADTLERVHDMVDELTARVSVAETERDAYREAIAGGRALLGMVLDVPVVVDHEPVACRADQFCEASAHYIACPSYTNSAGH